MVAELLGSCPKNSGIVPLPMGTRCNEEGQMKYRAIELTLVLEKAYGVKVSNLAEAEQIFATATSLTDYINAQKAQG